MCGIVGLLVKKPALRERLGELMVPMLVGMTERGPDSSGMAVFGEPVPDRERKLSLYCEAPEFDWKKFESQLVDRFANVRLRLQVNHAVLVTTSAPDDVRAWHVHNH